jgi:hypothetical protein
VTGWPRWLRRGIVLSARVPPIRSLLRGVCRLLTWEVGRELTKLTGVEAVYTRHSHPASATFVPGLSDIDLTVVMSDSAAKNAATVRACTVRVGLLGRLIPFVWAQDARFVAQRELAQIEAHPGAAEILNLPAGWIRIGGREVRREGPVPSLDRNRIPIHPEFNAWWHNVMQTHVLTPQMGGEEFSARFCLRVAMKNQLHLQVARGRWTPKVEGYLPDSDAKALFADDPQMATLLGESAREDRAAMILHRALGAAGAFYRDLPLPSDAAWVTLRDRSDAIGEAHRVKLREIFAREDALRSIAASIIVYATPHWTRREYQIALILQDSVSPEAFIKAVSAIKRSLGGRTFSLGDTDAQITLIPRRAFEHPWFYLGTPFPFLHEHVAAFAEALFGAPPRLPAPPPSAERWRWCAQYYLFHRFTLHYRPAYVSKDCNFCQLVALRIFLENGEVLTDAAEIHRRCISQLGKRSDDLQALNVLMGNVRGPLDEASFGAALNLQSQEYDAVETLLRRAGPYA